MGQHISANAASATTSLPYGESVGTRSNGHPLQVTPDQAEAAGANRACTLGATPTSIHAIENSSQVGKDQSIVVRKMLLNAVRKGDAETTAQILKSTESFPLRVQHLSHALAISCFSPQGVSRRKEAVTGARVLSL